MDGNICIAVIVGFAAFTDMVILERDLKTMPLHELLGTFSVQHSGFYFAKLVNHIYLCGLIEITMIAV